MNKTKYIKNNKKRKSKKICIYSSYDDESKVQGYVFKCLSEIYDYGFEIIFVTTSISLCKKDVNLLLKYCSVIINRENKGYDFTSWKIGAEQIKWSNVSNILLLNDSIIFPLYNFEGEMNLMINSDKDFWGLIDSRNEKKFINSFFWLFNEKIVKGKWLKNYLEKIPIETKEFYVENYETKIIDILEEKKHSYDTILSAKEIFKNTKCNEIEKFTHYRLFWDDMMLNHKSPFLKKNIMIKGHSEHLIYTNNVLETIIDENIKINIEKLLIGNHRKIIKCKVQQEVEIVIKKYEKMNLMIYGDTFLTRMVYNIIRRKHNYVKQVILKDEKLYEIANNKKINNINENSVILILSFNNYYPIKKKLQCMNISNEKIIKFWDIINDENKISYFKNLSLNLEYCITKSKYENESYFIVPPKNKFAFENIFEYHNITPKEISNSDFLFCMCLKNKYYKYV